MVNNLTTNLADIYKFSHIIIICKQYMVLQPYIYGILTENFKYEELLP